MVRTASEGLHRLDTIEQAFRYLPVPIDFRYRTEHRSGIMDVSVPRVSDAYPFCTEHSLELTRPSRGRANSITSYWPSGR